MNRIILSLAVALIVCAPALHAQADLSTTRIEAQHKPTDSMRKRLPQHEASLIQSLENENPAVQAQAVQTIRDLEQMFPKYAFEASLEPLANKLKDESADRAVRQLAALALDELHSDAGDAYIKEVASSCQDEGVKSLCEALLIRTLHE